MLCHEKVLINGVLWSLIHLEQLNWNGMRPEAEGPVKRRCHDGRLIEGDVGGGPEYPQQAAGGARVRGKGVWTHSQVLAWETRWEAESRMGRRTGRREQ